MQLKFNLLLSNPQLKTDEYVLINNLYLDNVLGLGFYLHKPINKPFVFSCFATSTDGKLCYPDINSGYAIAKGNSKATEVERYADWWNLSLGRAISDAVITGSNSVIAEHGNYNAELSILELKDLRHQLGKSKHLLHIIISRDSNKIDWSNQLLAKDNDLPCVIFSRNIPHNLPSYFIVSDSYQENVIKQVVLSDSMGIGKLIGELFEHGIQTILNESPYYHHHLQELKLLDEAWLNTSGVYIGGNVASLGANNSSFTMSNHPHYTILTLHSLGYNFIYTRYKISY